MELELTYGSIFSLINGFFSVINMLLLGFAVKKYQSKKNTQHAQAIPDEGEPKEQTYDKKKSLELVGSSNENFKRADVLISKVTECRLVEEFEKARDAKFFLKKGVNLKDLAKMLGSNQRYVSYILNKHVGMDFNNFIQQARVDYLIDSIEQDPDLLNVKFMVLADKAGFSSMSKFSSVFKSVKGVPPSEYFQRLRIAS